VGEWNNENGKLGARGNLSEVKVEWAIHPVIDSNKIRLFDLSQTPKPPLSLWVGLIFL
jgi:hypothetical protein